MYCHWGRRKCTFLREKENQTKQTKTKVLKAEGLGGLPVCLFSAVVELKQIVVGLLILSYIENNL